MIYEILQMFCERMQSFLEECNTLATKRDVSQVRMQLFYHRMQSVLGNSKLFARDCQVSQQNANVLREHANIL